MSGVFKAIGKVFKTVAKVVKKVALPALMIGAVVLTGGAAIGALPAIGTMLGSIGISGTLASVLGGAISMGAVGAVTGGIKSAITGGDIMKGATGGFVMGAATGGLLGGIGLVSPNGVLSDMGIGSSAAHLKGLTATNTLSNFAPGAAASASSSATPSAAATTPVGTAPPGFGAAAGSAPAAEGGLLSAVPPGFGGSGALTQAATAPAIAAPVAAAAGRSGISSILPTLLQTGGQVLSGYAQGAAAQAKSEEERLALQEERDRVAFNYGYSNVYATDNKGRSVGGLPIRQDRSYNYTEQQNLQPDAGLLGASFSQNYRTPYYQIVGGQVVQVGA